MSQILSWHHFFLAIAKVCALKSKDPHTQVGACLVNRKRQIVSTGYNGFPRGLNDDDYPWDKTGNALQTKYTYVVHAELNAITSACTELEGMALYTTLFPCAACTKIIIQAGIKSVFYLSDRYQDTFDGQAAVKMLQDAKIKFEKLADFTLELPLLKA